MRLEGPSILRIELLEELLIHFAQVKTAGIQPRKEERYLNYRIMDIYIYIYIMIINMRIDGSIYLIFIS